jgi:hypothetical protein
MYVLQLKPFSLKVCTGCGYSAVAFIPKRYLACCPDSRYRMVYSSEFRLSLLVYPNAPQSRHFFD